MPPTGRRPVVAKKAIPAAPQAISDTTSVEEVETSSTELEEAQKKIAELQDQLALAKGSNDPELEFDEVTNPGNKKNILIHFVRDGFCELGTIWYKGQELELEPGTPQYESAKRWAFYTPEEQEEFYKEVYFRAGPWKGKDYDDPSATEAERRRGRAAPKVTRD